VLVALAAGGVTLAALAFAVPYRPRIVRGPDAPAPEPAHVACPDLRLHVFTTGVARMSPLLAPGAPPWRPVPAFAIERAGALTLFDTGLAHEVAARGRDAFPAPMRWLFDARSRADRALDVQIREATTLPVRTIVLSHHHDDHTGTLGAFPGANVVDGAGVELGRPGPAPFERHHDLFGDGCVRLLAGGGHAPEDLMALLALPEGPVLLTGDAVVHFAWLASDDVERVAADPERAADVRNRVRAFLRLEPAPVVIPGHDLSRLPASRGDVILHHAEDFDPGAWFPRRKGDSTAS
jgi:glyoxylase-like metal-dependent hydrolase (beta-lactamase superfamily II)